MPKLRLLAYAAGTVKATVTSATWEHGVVVSSAAAANAVPVAEFTFAAIVMIAKDVFRVRDRHRDVRGQQPVTGRGPAGDVGTRGLRVGVIGASTIGRLVIERLSSLDVRVAVADPYLSDTDAAALGVDRVELDELFGWADVVTVHAPELPSTRHLVDADQLARMHDGAWLVNTARGSIVDTDASDTGVRRRPALRVHRHAGPRALAARVAAVRPPERGAHAAHRGLPRHRDLAHG